MTTTSWDEMSRRWRELTEAQADATTKWVKAQSQLASAFTDADPTGDPAANAAAMAEMWRSSMALGGTFSQAFPAMEAGGITNDILTRMLNPLSTTLVGGNQVGDVIRRMTEGPRLADAGVLERGMAELMELYVRFQTAAHTYEGVVRGAWTEANRRFANDISERVRAGETLRPGQEALRRWMDIANDTLTESQRSSEFLAAQRDLLRAGMDFLLAERAFFEKLVEPVGLPTRTEIDEVHRSVWELKRRVRTLERMGDPQADGAEERKRSARSARPGAGNARRNKPKAARPKEKR